MREFTFLLMYLLTIITTAQTIINDDMNSYSEGELIYQDHWTAWSDPSQAILPSSEQAYDGVLSGKVSGNEITSAILKLGNRIFSDPPIYLSFRMYIPSDQ